MWGSVVHLSFISNHNHEVEFHSITCWLGLTVLSCWMSHCESLNGGNKRDAGSWPPLPTWAESAWIRQCVSKGESRFVFFPLFSLPWALHRGWGQMISPGSIIWWFPSRAFYQECVRCEMRHPWLQGLPTQRYILFTAQRPWTQCRKEGAIPAASPAATGHAQHRHSLLLDREGKCRNKVAKCFRQCLWACQARGQGRRSAEAKTRSFELKLFARKYASLFHLLEPCSAVRNTAFHL